MQQRREPDSHVPPVLRVDSGPPLDQPLRDRDHRRRPHRHVQRGVAVTPIRRQAYVGRVLQEEQRSKFVACNTNRPVTRGVAILKGRPNFWKKVNLPTQGTEKEGTKGVKTRGKMQGLQRSWS